MSYDELHAKALRDLTAAQQRVAVLEAALRELLDRYTFLVDSGDCGCWDSYKEPCVIAARAALASTEPTE